jgi:hypothetical protein
MPNVQRLLLCATFLTFTACGGGGEDDSATPDTDAESTAEQTVEGANAFADCAGPHTGSFTGDFSGTSTGEVGADGTVTFEFTSSLGSFSSTGTIAEDGAISAGGGDVTVEGTYDFETCTASGTWDDTYLGAAGEWVCERDA